MAISQSQAFADDVQEDDSPEQAAVEENEQAKLQVSDYVHVTGGTSFYNAPNLPVNKTNSFTYGDIDGSKDYYFKFTITSDGSLNLPTFDAGDGRVETTQGFVIYNSSKDAIYSFDDYNISYINKTVGLAKGTYYVKFRVTYYSSWGTSRTLTMRLNYTQSNAWEKESNDTFEYANSVSVNKVYYASGVNRSVDYFKFTLAQTARVRVAIKNDDSIRAYLYSSNLNKLGGWYQSSKAGLTVDEDAEFTLQKGTYYLKFGDSSLSGSMQYSFKLMTTNISKITMHRLYNKYTGEHFYTKDATEKNNLVKKGWKYEGVGWYAPSTSSKPVYRLYNPFVAGGDHHYTMSSDERDRLKKAGWRDEGVGWYSDPNEGVGLYRQYNPNAKTGTHNYTTSATENDNLIKVGWRAEGMAWYGMK